MKILAMFGAYKGSTEVPELLEAWDEYARDENVDGYFEAHEKWRTDPDLEAFAVVTFEVDGQAVHRALYPKPVTVAAEVVSVTSGGAR